MIESNGIYRHPTALVHGEVVFSTGVSLWPYSVIRAELNRVLVGKYSNLQDFVMVHIGYDTDTVIGDYCTVAHHCTIHGCSIGNNCLIGINATIMDGAVIGDNCIIAGHTLVKEGSVIPANSVVAGTPGKVIRTVADPRPNIANALMYHRNAMAYAGGDHRLWSRLKPADLTAEAEAVLRAQAG